MQLVHGSVACRLCEERRRAAFRHIGRTFPVCCVENNHEEHLPDVASYKIVIPDDVIDVGLERLDDADLDGLFFLLRSSVITVVVVVVVVIVVVVVVVVDGLLFVVVVVGGVGDLLQIEDGRADDVIVIIGGGGSGVGELSPIEDIIKPSSSVSFSSALSTSWPSRSRTFPGTVMGTSGKIEFR